MRGVPRNCVEMLYGPWIKMEGEHKRRNTESAWQLVHARRKHLAPV